MISSAASWLLPGLTRHRSTIHRSSGHSSPRTRCGHGEHPPLREACPPPHPGVLLPQCTVVTLGEKHSPCGRRCARGWSLKPPGHPASLVGSELADEGPVPLTNTGLTGSDLRPPPTSLRTVPLTSEADSSAWGPQAAVGLWLLPAAVSVLGRTWGRAEARPARLPSPVLVALPAAFHAGAGVLAKARLQAPVPRWTAQSCQAGLAPDKVPHVPPPFGLRRCL